MTFPARINKHLADLGLATRRGADALIESGKVFVNGKRAILGQQIQEKDVVEVRDTVKHAYRYILYYKPKGVITHSPEEGEVDIVTRVMKDHSLKGVFPIGRLDKNSEGLILLTNDGRVTERILSPDAVHEKEYEVVVDKKVTSGFLKHMSLGVNIERYMTRPAKVIMHPRSDHAFLITLTEGKKHQVRRMCAALGYQVQNLKRIRIMNLKLQQLKSGQYYELKSREAQDFLKSLNLPTIR